MYTRAYVHIYMHIMNIHIYIHIYVILLLSRVEIESQLHMPSESMTPFALWEVDLRVAAADFMGGLVYYLVQRRLPGSKAKEKGAAL